MLTRWKEETLSRHGYAVVTLWECQWDERKKKEEPLSEWCEQLSLVWPLKQRDAFYGGRTGCTTLKSELSNEETAGDVDAINYFDFTSLYPSCNICRRHDERLASPVPREKPNLEPTEPIGSWDASDMDPYPVGHPIIKSYTQSNQQERGREGMSLDISEVYGYVKCTILPPRQLYHPVLPYRCNGKLMKKMCNKMCFCSVNVYWNDNPIFVDACTVSMVKRIGLNTWVHMHVTAMTLFPALLRNQVLAVLHVLELLVWIIAGIICVLIIMHKKKFRNWIIRKRNC